MSDLAFFEAICEECQENHADDYDLFTQFNGFSICSKCKHKAPELFKLISKSTLQKEYLMTDDDIANYGLTWIEKPNPRGSRYSRMKLFIRYQAQCAAIKKFQSLQALDDEKIRRKNSALLKRESAYEKKLKELKLASICTESIVLKSAVKRHIHKFEDLKEQNLKKCTICGLAIVVESF